MMTRLLFMLAISASFQLQAQNCGITVDVGLDLFICTPVDNVNLSGQITGDFAGVEWTSINGVTSPNNPNTSATINSTRTFTLTAFGDQPLSNLVNNGDFSQGATGFTSSYSPGSGGIFGLLSNESEYVVLSNSGAAHNGFASCTDHTGDGNMMVVNGATIANQNIWCQTISVTPGIHYAFSAWVTSVVSDAPAILQFAINGELLGGTYNASSSLCTWGSYNATWNAEAATSATICITNQNTAGGGNDFAIDDILFGPVCTDSDEVTVNVLDIQAVIAEPVPFPCNANANTTITLDGTGSSTESGVIYQWTTDDGNIVSGANTLLPEINLLGTYTLHVSYPSGGSSCFDTQTVTVTETTNIPIAVANAPNEINCTQNIVTISGQGSTEGPDITYEWTTNDGNIVNGATTLTPEVDGIGTYTLTVTNTMNNCNGMVEVMVAGDNTPPNIVILPPEEITCSNSEIFLDGTGSTISPNITHTWTTNDGNIQSNENSLTPTVNQAGIYTLTLINSDNGCEASTSVTIVENTTAPSVEAGTAETLNCNLNQISLQGNSDNGTNLIYEWTSNDGQIVSGFSTLNPIIAATGTYRLVVTNTDNDCVASDTVIVIENNPNTFDFDVDFPNCVEPVGDISFVNVEGGVSPYLYSINGGETFTSTSTFNALATGTYNLIVQDVNGCELENSAFVPSITEVQISLETSAELTLGDSHQLNALVNIPEEDIVNITWTPADSLSCFDCLNPTATPNETTVYQISLEDVNGCVAEAQIEILVDRQIAVYIPNAFSPDKNGENEIFFIQSKVGIVKEVQEFLIFDRWGETVFEKYHFQANNPAHGWDGLVGGKVPNPSVFGYVAILEMLDGHIEIFTGDVSLMR